MKKETSGGGGAEHIYGHSLQVTVGQFRPHLLLQSTLHDWSSSVWLISGIHNVVPVHSSLVETPQIRKVIRSGAKAGGWGESG